MAQLALVRHGQSQWNLEDRFTGWWDVDLTPAGEEEARASGRLLKATGVDFARAYTSVQKRAIRTLWLALDADGPPLAAGDQGLPPQRAPLWRPHRPQQERDRGQARRRAGEGLAPLLRHPAARSGARLRIRSRARSALSRHRHPEDRKPQDDARARPALLELRDRAQAEGRRKHPHRRARQFAARHRQAPVRRAGQRRSSKSRSRPAIRC